MATKRTYQPSKTRRARRHGFLVRSRTPGGRKVLRNRRARPAPPRALAAADKRFGLGAARRLTQKAQFETLLRQGARRTLDGYTIYVAQRDSGTARLGMLVSRKHSARAVVRNGIKRCIREAFRLERERLGPLDILVRPPYGARPSAEMILQLRDVLARLKP